MGVMLFPSSWLGNASRGGGGGASLAPHSLFSSLPSSLSSIPLLLSFLSSLFLSPLLSHLLLLLSLSSVPIFFSSSLLLVFFSLCLSPLSPFPLSLFLFFYINLFLFCPHLFPSFLLRELLVLCALRKLLVLCALREFLVLYAFYDVIGDTIDCNQP